MLEGPVAYRDRPPSCPRCHVELRRRARRDIWRCPRCAGTQLASAEVARRLRLTDPDLPDEVIQDVLTVRRSRGAAVGCPTCARPMQTIALCGVDVGRCDGDDQLWLDASALDRIVARAHARHQLQRSWLRRLLSHLYAT